MKNAMRKTTFREIKNSFSRWIAILAICALGVGFFTGLKICKEDFLLTGSQFLSKTHFYDFQLVSTLGLEQEDVESVRQVSGVENAVGSYSQDVLFSLDGSNAGDKVAHTHALLENINTPDLQAGNLPDKPNQCVGDARYFTEDDIGKTIVLSASNDSDTLDMFAYTKYELVGICESPLYLNFERGSTSLGDGSVSTYFYIPSKGYNSDVYTEIYVAMDNPGRIYSDEYQVAADKLEQPLTDVLENCADRRYDDVLAKAQDKVSDGEEKLDDAKAELAAAQKKITDGEKEITDGEKVLASNEKKLADGTKKLQDGRTEYEKNLSDFQTEKKSAYDALAQQKSQIDAMKGTPAYDQALEQYTAAKETADAKFAEAQQQLDIAKATLDQKEAQLSSSEKKLRNARSELAAHKKELQDGKDDLKDGEKKVADAEKKIKKAKKKISEIQSPKTYVLSRETNIGYVCFDNDTNIVDSIAKVFPVFFFLVAALVCMTTMTRMIDEQRTQIGVLKALGYSRWRIMGKYLFYSISASLLGGIIGFFVGITLFPEIIWTAYGMMYDFADLITTLNWKLGILSIAAAVACCAAATLYCCFSELSNVPAELIRPKAPAAGKRILLERIPLVWDKLKFLHKVCLRNIFRYEKRFFMMLLGICGCTALLITALGLSDSIKNIVTAQYDEIYHNDYTITFDSNISQKEKEQFVSENRDYIDEIIFVDALSVDIRTAGKTKSINMIAADPNEQIADFITLKDKDGLLAYPSAGNCILNENLAENLNISVGDEITLYDSDMREMKVTVQSLCTNYVYNYVYVNDETFTSFWGKPDANTALVIAKDGITGNTHSGSTAASESASASGSELKAGPESASETQTSTTSDNRPSSSTLHKISAALMDADHVVSISLTQDMRDRVNNMMKSLDAVIALIMACAGALAFIVLYNLTNINITERIREIATIKVLGFYPSETNAYVFRENLVLTVISALVGIPAGKAFHSFVMSEIQVDLLSFDVHIQPISYLIAVLMTIGFALIVNFAMYFKLDKINMAESLKSIE